MNDLADFSIDVKAQMTDVIRVGQEPPARSPEMMEKWRLFNVPVRPLADEHIK